jgi:hypothetical protein
VILPVPSPSATQALRLVRRLVPSDGSITGLVDAVAAHRGRPIEITAAYLGPRSAAGFWVVAADRDHIVHAATATGGIRDLVISHELAHMLLDHRQDSPLGVPGIERGGPTRLLTTHGYGAEAEAAALRLARQTVRLLVVRRHSARLGLNRQAAG